MNRQALQNLALVIGSIMFALVAIEVGGRLLMQPSGAGSGALFGRDLPPLRMTGVDEAPAYDPGAWHGGLIVDGRRISHGDQHGIFRPDPLLGLTYQESATSASGWWQSNNVGARAAYDVDRAVAPGKTRVLVFGESFAQGSRLPQDQAWPNMIDDRNAGLEVLNFAVDGYSMGQALLRYQHVRELLDYDVVVLMFVPDADLWRDINVVRDLAERGWRPPIVLPRFVLDEGGLKLVPPLYANPLEVYSRNAEGISGELHEHLLRYDRFYYPESFTAPPMLGASVLYRLIAYARWVQKRRAMRANLMDPSGEAMQVSRAIFSTMRDHAAADDALFILAILPVEFEWREAAHRPQWQDMVSFVCPDGIACVDLLDDLQQLPVDDYDYAHDNSHFGPGINARIAAVIEAALEHPVAGEE